MLSSNQNIEQHPLFPSGEWEGFFTYAMGNYAPRTPMQLNLTFKNQTVKGYGYDEVGPFRWQGEYDIITNKCLLTKLYIGKHQVFYNGHADENGIWGTWTIPPYTKGGFHIWPNQRSIKNKAEEIICTKQTLSY